MFSTYVVTSLTSRKPSAGSKPNVLIIADVFREIDGGMYEQNRDVFMQMTNVTDSSRISRNAVRLLALAEVVEHHIALSCAGAGYRNNSSLYIPISSIMSEVTKKHAVAWQKAQITSKLIGPCRKRKSSSRSSRAVAGRLTVGKHRGWDVGSASGFSFIC